MNLKTVKYTPAVNKRLVILFAGFLWICVGVMLDTFAAKWLINYGQNLAFVFAIAGFCLSLIIHHFGFLRIVDKNLGRISKMEGKPCAFSFMSWKSYILVAVMVTLGILLRHSSVPRQYLSVLYIGIGTALLLSSVRYFRNALKVTGKIYP